MTLPVLHVCSDIEPKVATAHQPLIQVVQWDKQTLEEEEHTLPLLNSHKFKER